VFKVLLKILNDNFPGLEKYPTKKHKTVIMEQIKLLVKYVLVSIFSGKSNGLTSKKEPIIK
jgi:hypothetical protein